METKQVAEIIHKVLGDEKLDLGKIDSADMEVQQDVSDPGGDAWGFKFYENVNRPNPDYKGWGPSRTIPVGHFEYTVTVTKQWVPFEEGTLAPST